MAKADGQSRWPMTLLLLARRFGRRGEGLRGRRANPVAGALLLLARWLGRCSLRRQRCGVGRSSTRVRPPRAEESGSRSGTRAVRRGKEANDIVDSGRRERNGVIAELINYETRYSINSIVGEGRNMQNPRPHHPRPPEPTGK